MVDPKDEIQNVILSQSEADVKKWLESPESEGVEFCGATDINGCLVTRFYQHVLNTPDVVTSFGLHTNGQIYMLPRPMRMLMSKYDERMSKLGNGPFSRDDVKSIVFPLSKWEQIKARYFGA